MLKIKKITLFVIAVSLAFVTIAYQPAIAFGQATQAASGMTGVVTDPSGAVVPGVAVMLTNTTTGAKYTATTNSVGVYEFINIPPGQGYDAVFTGTGFSPVEVKNIYLTAETVRTQNAALKVGVGQQVVEVSASNSEVTIDTTDATVGNNIDVKELNNLPVQQRNNPFALMTLQPGVTTSGSVTGARVDQNDVTVDGLDVNDFATGGAMQSNTGPGVVSGFTLVGNAPVDSLEEFHAGVAGNEADTGQASGGQFQMVTKSGTNQFHGDLNEYHRDPSLVANSWFSNNSNPIVPRNHLIQNQFGGSIGGPIKRNKAFFFFDFNDSRVISSTLVQRTVPLDSLRNGMVGYINSSGTNTYLTPAQVQALDPAGIGEDSTWVTGFSARFPHSNNQITGDGVNSGGYNFNAPFNDFGINYVGRIDYTINDSMKLFGRFTLARENSVLNPNEFGGDPITDPQIDRSYAFVIGHTWVIGSNKTNRAIIGETVQKLSFPNDYNPDGSTFFTFSDGTGPALASSLYLNPAAQARRVPIPVVGDDFTWMKGSHILQFGGTFKDILAHNTVVGDFNTTEVGEGGNMLALCGPTPGDCGVGNPSLRPSDINQGAQVNTAEYDWDQVFPFMLARIADISADFNYTASGNSIPQLSGDQRLYRYYETELYAQDTWKILPSLTFTYGVSYQLNSVPYEVHGLESVEPVSFENYLKDRVQQSSSSQSGPTALPLLTYYLGGQANGGSAPSLYNPQHALFAPHVGFNWNPGFDKKTVFNGGVGLVYDRTVINAIEQIQDGDSYLFQQTEPLPYGIPGNSYDTVKTAARLDAQNGISTVSFGPPPTPKPPYAPFTGTACPAALASPCGLQLGLAFNATIDPALKTPYSIGYNFGVQRQMAWDTVLKASFVGRLGRRLLGQPDANQVLEYPDPTSGQLLSQAFGNLTKELRAGATTSTVTVQPWFENLMPASFKAAVGQPTNTQAFVAAFTPFIFRGDFGDSVQFLAANGLPLNIGSAAQYSENTFYSNLGFSSYDAFLLTLQKNLAHGLQFDFNYAFSHSIDNTSFFANSAGDTGIGGIGLICDVIHPRECRANSDFDLRNNLTADSYYGLPFGRKRMFFPNASTWVNEVIGDWDVSGIASWHSGNVWGTDSNAFVASYSNNAPGILIGNKSAVATHLTKFASGGVNNFANQNGTTENDAADAYEGPIGFQIGPRNGLRGPGYFNTDLGLAKLFPIHGETTNLQFRADGFNALNHPNFQSPANNVFNGLDQQDITNPSFGTISYTVVPTGNLNNGARVLQLSLRLQF